MNPTIKMDVPMATLSSVSLASVINSHWLLKSQATAELSLSEAKEKCSWVNRKKRK